MTTPNNKVETPRTDLASQEISEWLRRQPDIEIVATVFARQLETELIAANAEVELLRRVLKNCVASLEVRNRYIPSSVTSDVINEAKQALTPSKGEL